MGERKGTNKYYPPDFDPKKHVSLDRYHGTHALRERAKKLNQGILVIRFEMPYNIWCGGCGIHIAMGVRYNAEKSKVGNYYSTPIWKFRMKCHLCDQYFEIKTDPANHDYVIISGARRKEQRWDPKDNEQIVTEDKNDVKKRATDAMFKLEHAAEDKAKVKKVIPGIAEITEIQQQWKDDYLLNKNARQKFREEKKLLLSEAAKDSALLIKSSLDIELVQEHEEDIKIAQLMKYRTVESFEEKQQQKREEIKNRSLFLENDMNKPGMSSNNEMISIPQNKEKTKIENTKHKLKVAISQSNRNSFCSSNLKPNSSKCAKELGIVKKTNLTSQSKDAKLKDISCTNTDNQKSLNDSGGLGSLIMNYDSSSSNDSS